MKGYLLSFIISTLAFMSTTFVITGLNYHGNTTVLLEVSAAFGLLEVFVRPILKLLLLPLNFLTLGFLSGVSGLLIIWLLTVLVPRFSLTDTHFPGYTISHITIPSFDLNVFLTALIGALLISVISSILYWITK
jgi:putative membrane protein